MTALDEVALLEAERDRICVRLLNPESDAVFAEAMLELESLDLQVEVLMGATPEYKARQIAIWAMFDEAFFIAHAAADGGAEAA